MNTLFWVKGARGVICLETVLSQGFKIAGLVLQHQPDTSWYAKSVTIAQANGIPVIHPDDPNSPEAINALRAFQPDLFVLAGYGKIIEQAVIDLPANGCINLHGGKLPEYRGSSPLNWVLINDEKKFGISIIQVDAGVDTGDILAERQFPIEENDTIADLHKKANAAFPKMLCGVLADLEADRIKPINQSSDTAAYHPARFPDDGLILFDALTAREIHNRIRALTTPYPCAYTIYKGRKVRLVASRLRSMDFFGEPGRVYLKKDGALLVCAKDKCLWIDQTQFDDDESNAYEVIDRYERLATLAQAAERFLCNL